MSLILQGDALTQLRTLPDESVDCCVTSPPYWGLRDYGVAGQLGLERTPQEYVAHLVAVFREVRRVLRKDATLWLNLGDSYATGAGKVGNCPGGGKQGARYRGGHGPDLKNKAIGPRTQPNRMPIAGLKPKDLVGIPWRVAFALQEDGWYLRSDIIWHKPNPMPESVRDRPTKAHEYLFLLSKSAKYYYDADAIREPLSDGPLGGRQRAEAQGKPTTVGKAYDHGRNRRMSAGNGPHRLDALRGSGNKARKLGDGSDGRLNNHLGRNVPWRPDLSRSRNKRTVWKIAPAPFMGAHFATFPPKLIEPCILAGCPKGGIVLDPFAGAFTTPLVAQQHGRDFVAIELNPEYVAMGIQRLGLDRRIAA